MSNKGVEIKCGVRVEESIEYYLVGIITRVLSLKWGIIIYFDIE